MALDALRGYVQIAGGLTDVTKQRAVATAKQLVDSGSGIVDQAVSAPVSRQVQGVAEELLATSRMSRDLLIGIIRSEVERTVARLGLVGADELSAMAKIVSRLQRQVDGPGGSDDTFGTPFDDEPEAVAAFESAAQPAAKKVPAKKVPAKKVPAKKVPAKKVAVKMVPAKKVAVKKVAVKVPAKQAAVPPAVAADVPAPPAVEATPEHLTESLGELLPEALVQEMVERAEGTEGAGTAVTGVSDAGSDTGEGV